MNQDELQQLSDLLSLINASNGGEGQIYIGELVIYNKHDKPCAKVEFDDNGERLIVTSIIPEFVKGAA